MRIDASEVDRLRKELHSRGSGRLVTELKKANHDSGKIITDAAQARARSGTRQQSAAAKAIKPSENRKGIHIRIAGGKSVPFALAAFWGMNTKSGWYAHPRYAASVGRQSERWVGTSWEVGGAGGPYALNPAIRDNKERVLTNWVSTIKRALGEAD